MTADREFKLVALKGSAVPVDTRGRALHDLRISVMDRCNFRCPYCMPRETFHENYRFLKSSERLSFEEIVRLTRLFVSLGVRKVRLTGGEPLLRANLPDLVGELTNTYLSVSSNRMNEVMKLLTVMTSIFIPLTFLAGIYGMNFQNIPELAVPWAYPALLCAMLVIAVIMLIYFWRRGWIGKGSGEGDQKQ